MNVQIHENKTADGMLADFQYNLQDWAAKKYGSRAEAAKHLEVSEKTLNNWKNRNSLK